MRIALSLFWSWLFSSWQVTTRPDGLWVIRTAESVVLTDCPPGPLERYTSMVEVVGVDLDVDLLGLGQHRDRRRAGVDAALALGDRHPLHAVGTGLVLEPRPGVVALHHEGDLAQPAHVGLLAGEHLDLPLVLVGVALVHLEEVGGPEVGLFAALAAADLDDHVLAVVGVAGHEQLAQLGVELAEERLPSRRSRSSRYSRISASDSPSSISRASASSSSVARYDRYASTTGFSSDMATAGRRARPAGRRTRRARRAATRASPARSPGRRGVRTRATSVGQVRRRSAGGRSRRPDDRRGIDVEPAPAARWRRAVRKSVVVHQVAVLVELR